MENITVKTLPSPTWRWLRVNNITIKDVPKEVITPKLATGESQVIIYDYTEGEGGTLNVEINSTLPKDSQLTIVTINRMADEDLYFNYNIDVEENAKLKVIQLFLDGKETFGTVHARLNGKAASFELASAYLLKSGQKLDLNYVCDHYGKNTECNMISNGVLYKGAEKIYRGTIDFKRGCKGAVGNETEDVLLMDDDIINKTVPVILCAEEDVEGNHGATIGKINDELMFYMTSRGLDESTIYDMLAKARMESVAKLIPDEELKDKILELI